MIDCNGQRQRKRWIRVSIKSREKEKQIGVQCMKTNRVRYYCPLNERTPCKWTERAIMWTTENQTRWLNMHEDQFAGNHLSIVFSWDGFCLERKIDGFWNWFFGKPQRQICGLHLRRTERYSIYSMILPTKSLRIDTFPLKSLSKLWLVQSHLLDWKTVNFDSQIHVLNVYVYHTLAEYRHNKHIGKLVIRRWQYSFSFQI